MKQLNKDNFKEFINQDKVLVKFSTEFCYPCKLLAKSLQEMTDVTSGEISAEDESEIADFYNVQSVPTLIIFQKGKEVRRAVGITRKKDVQELWR